MGRPRLSLIKASELLLCQGRALLKTQGRALLKSHKLLLWKPSMIFSEVFGLLHVLDPKYWALMVYPKVLHLQTLRLGLATS